ncbi:hypothetical protein ACVIHF_006458 [Bradyrhizobium sp. USDA 4506]
MPETCCSVASLILEQHALIGEDVREMPGNGADERVISVAAPGDEPKFAWRRGVREFAGTQLPFGSADEMRKQGYARAGLCGRGLRGLVAGPEGHARMGKFPEQPQRFGKMGIGLVETDEHGLVAGDVVGFALGAEQPGDLLYVTGDTLWFEGTAEVARRFSPKLVVLFTGAAEPRGRFHMTMGSEDALEAAHAFPDAALVAVHNEGWGHLRESQDQLLDVFAKFNLAARLTRLEKGKPLPLSW